MMGEDERRIPALVHEYAIAYYQWRKRSGHQDLYFMRKQWDAMSNAEVEAEFDRVRELVADLWAMREVAHS